MSLKVKDQPMILNFSIVIFVVAYIMICKANHIISSVLKQKNFFLQFYSGIDAKLPICVDATILAQAFLD